MSLFEYDEKKHERTMMKIGREEGQMQKELALIIKKVKKEKSLEQIADELEEDIDIIQPLYEIVLRHAPAYDEDAMLKEIFK